MVVSRSSTKNGSLSFPGKPSKRHDKTRVSFKDTTVGTSSSAEASAYSRKTAATVSSIKTFKSLFDTDDDEEHVTFNGFDDNDELVSTIKTRKVNLSQEVADATKSDQRITRRPSTRRSTKAAQSDIPKYVNKLPVTNVSSDELKIASAIVVKKSVMPSTSTTTENGKEKVPQETKTTLSKSTEKEIVPNEEVKRKKSTTANGNEETHTEETQIIPAKTIEKISQDVTTNETKRRGRKKLSTTDEITIVEQVVPIEEAKEEATNDESQLKKAVTGDKLKQLQFLPQKSSRSSRKITPNKRFLEEEEKKPQHLKVDKQSQGVKKRARVSSGDKLTSTKKSALENGEGNGITTPDVPVVYARKSVPPPISSPSNFTVGLSSKKFRNLLQGQCNSDEEDTDMQSTNGTDTETNIGNDKKLEVEAITADVKILYQDRKDFFGAGIMPEQTNKGKVSTKSKKALEGIFVCGLCRDVFKSCSLANMIKNGVFLCPSCATRVNQLMKLVQKAKAVDKLHNCIGGCPILQLSGNTTATNQQQCNACFSIVCLRVLELRDDIYFKLWRLIPPTVLDFVKIDPTPSSKPHEDFPNAGKIVYVDESGEICSSSPVLIRINFRCTVLNNINIRQLVHPQPPL